MLRIGIIYYDTLVLDYAHKLLLSVNNIYFYQINSYYTNCKKCLRDCFFKCKLYNNINLLLPTEQTLGTIIN